MAETVIRYRGKRDDLIRKLRELPGVFAGRIPDPNKITESVLMAAGVTLLGKVQDSYVTKSEGGTDAMGITWQPLSPVTLSLRRKGTTSAKAMVKLGKMFKDAPKSRQRLIRRNYQKLKELYESDMAERGKPGSRAKRAAIRILHLTKPYITEARFKKTLAELNRSDFLKTIRGKKKLKTAREMIRDREAIKRTSLAGAFALILRDTGRLLNSLSPEHRGSVDQQLKIAPGVLTVGSNVSYFVYHQSNEPRKLKKDGTPILPRRQVLPDETHPMPDSWKNAMGSTIVNAISSKEFWTSYLSI